MGDAPRVEATLHAGRLRLRAQADLATAAVNLVGPKLHTDTVAVEHAQRLSVSIDGPVVRIQAPPPPVRGRAPQLLVDLSVPSGTQVSVDAGDAQVVATGSLGSLRAHTSSGSVSAETVDGPIDVRTGRGPVTIHDCGGGAIDVSDGVVILRSSRGPLDVRGRSGDVHVWWVDAPTTVATSTGNVYLGWAHDRPVRLDIRTELGRCDVTVPDSRSAPDSLTVTSVVGDITVKPAEARQAVLARGPRTVADGVRAITTRWRPLWRRGRTDRGS